MNTHTLTVLSAVAILTGCAAPAVDTGGTADQAASVLTGGVYIAGEDIEPGRYRTPGGDGCAYTVQENFDPDSATTDMGSADGPLSTVVADGERFFVSGDCAFELVE